MKNINTRLQEMTNKLSSKELFESNGLGNEINFHVFDYDIIALREGHVVAVFGFEELCPWAHHEEVVACALHVFYAHILIMLWSIWSHLEPQHSVGI